MVDWTRVAKVKASAHRKKILCQLVDQSPKTPSELRDLTDIAISHVSTKLQELVNWGLVVCLTPNIRRGKLYSITKEGLEISKYVDCN